MAAKNASPDGAAAPSADPAAAPSQAPAVVSIPNRPGEPAFALDLSPDCVTFVCTPDKKPVWCDVHLKNTSTELQSYKVKCTSADIFRVQPPLGYVKPGEQANIRVWFQNKTAPDQAAKHYFAVYHMKGNDKQTPAKEIWNKSAKAEGVRRLSAVFTDKSSA